MRGGDAVRGCGLQLPHRPAQRPGDTVPARFIPLADVAETLAISSAQAYALVRTGELPAIKVGGRGQWRVEEAELEKYIQRMYAQTRESVQALEGHQSA
nr:helix-turn-helix domain-containing protein [Kineococcus vitellinus]